MYYHVYDGINVWSKIGCRCYSYRATCKNNSFIMYYMKLLVTVSVEIKQCTKNLTCDCTSHHGTQSLDLYYLQFLTYRVVN